MKTVLCVPGHDLKKVEGCRRYGADLILFDLEDSVPEGKKELAREIVKAHVTEADAVRVNAHRGTQDLAAIGAWHPLAAMKNLRKIHSVWLPKGEALAFYNYRIPTVHIIETPWSVQQLSTLDRQPIEVAGLAFGAADFSAYMNVPADSPQVDYARQQVALAAAALGVPAYDSPFVNLRPDSLGSLRKSAHEALVLGYQWKGVVHPAQIPIVRDVKYEALFDEMLIRDYDRERGEDAVALVDGHVVAPPMIRAARKRLEDNER